MAESPRDRTRADRLLVILSDIELGAGGVLDDCPDSDFIGELILGYNRGSSAALPVDLVLNGDTFDLLKTSLDGSFPRHISEPVALAKFALVADAHPDFFEALGAFLAHEEAPRRVHFVVGNHDLELQFTGVPREILRRVGGRGEIRFPGFEMAIGDVHIEHGAQEDPMFAVDLSRPFVRHKGEVILENPLTILWIAVPLFIQTTVIFGLGYVLARLLKLSYEDAAPSAMIGASNHFEVAIATATMLFGLSSGAALATVVGVLIEVPVMLMLVKICLRTQHLFRT